MQLDCEDNLFCYAFAMAINSYVKQSINVQYDESVELFIKLVRY